MLLGKKMFSYIQFSRFVYLNRLSSQRVKAIMLNFFEKQPVNNGNPGCIWKTNTRLNSFMYGRRIEEEEREKWGSHLYPLSLCLSDCIPIPISLCIFVYRLVLFDLCNAPFIYHHCFEIQCLTNVHIFTASDPCTVLYVFWCFHSTFIHKHLCISKPCKS